MDVSGACDEDRETVSGSNSCFEIKHGVPISTFDLSVENFLSAMETISELCCGNKEETFEVSEIERFKSMVVFMREWKQLYFSEWMPSHCNSKTIDFAYEAEFAEVNCVINGINLPLFSSAAVPKQIDRSLCTESMPDNDDFVLQVGGSVWALDWCPRLHENTGCNVEIEYLAVAAHPPGSEYHKIGEQLSGRGSIQIWCFLHLGNNDEVHISEGARRRGRPKKASHSISSETIKPSNNMENPSAPFTIRGFGSSNDSGVSSEFNTNEVPKNSYNAADLVCSNGTYSHVDNSVEGPRSSGSRKIPVAKKVKPRGRPRKHPISNSNDCEVICSDQLLDSFSSASRDFWSLSGPITPKDIFIPTGIALPRLVLSVAHNGKVAWDMKWRPTDFADLKRKHHLGYLAVLLGNGSLEVWEVPVHGIVRLLYTTCHTEGTDPRFLKLQPVFRCSRVNFGGRQSIPLTLEWSPSASRDLILAGCHDGTVALWKFSSQHSFQDTKPLLCFTADTVPIRSLAWAPDESDAECSNIIVTAGHEGLKFWDLRDPYHPMWDFCPVQRAVLGIDWLKNPKCIVIAYEDGALRILSLARAANDMPITGEISAKTKQQGAHFQSCSSFAIWSVQVSRTSGHVAYCSSDGCTRHFQLTEEAVNKDSSRYRKPHLVCGSFVEEGPTIRINTHFTSTPLPEQTFVSKAVNEATPANSSMLALCWQEDHTIKFNSRQKKRKGNPRRAVEAGEDVGALQCIQDKRDESRLNIMKFPPKSVALHKVMPSLWCRLDRIWFGYPGVMEGTLTRQLFLCPMDHIFEVNVMLKDLPEEKFGPKMDFREYSFIQNPRLSKEVKQSFLEVELCEQQTSKCHVSNQTARQRFLRLPKHSTQEME